MKNIKLITLTLVLSFGIFGCTNKFLELNEPQTGDNVTDPGPMFTRALVTGSGMSYQIYQRVHQLGASVWAQHWANVKQNWQSDNYQPQLVFSSDIWRYYYAQKYFAPISLNYQTMSLIEQIDQNPIQLASAKIWNVYLFSLVTDMFGDIPYSEAMRSLKPKYDNQKFIYEHMLNELEAAVRTIEENKEIGYPTFGSADVLYNGDMNKWVKFANSLKLRLAMRVSNVDPELTRKHIANLDPSKVISSNSESAYLLTETADQAVTHEVKNGVGFIYVWNEVRVSKNMMGYLNGSKFSGVEDPRIRQFAEPTKETGEYIGLENGTDPNVLGSNPEWYFNNHSNIGPYYSTQDYNVELFIMTHAEVKFLMAEAKLKGFMNTGSSAEQYYKEGIAASMEQVRYFWDGSEAISADAESAYMSQTGVAFNAAEGEKQIITQKWIALYPNGLEAWNEMRRTGYPAIDKPLYTYPGNDEMPRRFLYSSDEVNYNGQSVQAAIDRMGGNSQYTRMWWDKGN